MTTEAERTDQDVAARSASVRYPLFELWVIALTTAAVASLLLSFRGHVDDDLWLHLRIGEELRQGTRFGHLPDPLVALGDRPYVPTQWLAEAAGSLAYDVFGLPGIHLMRLIAVAALLLLVFQMMRQFLTSVPAGVVTIPVVFATSAAWAERPQLLGLAIFALTLLLWLRSWARGRSAWPTVPLLWIWACVHGTWIFGLVTAAIFTLVGSADREVRPSLRHSILILLSSVAAVAITPLGPAVLAQPFNVNEAAKNSVSEWQTPQWDNPTFIVVVATVIITLVVLALRRKQPLAVLLLTGFAGALAVYSVRTVAFGAIVAGSGLAIAASRRYWPANPRPAEQVPFVVAAAALIVAGLIAGPPPARPGSPDLASALDSLPAQSHVAVDPGVSGWVLFHARSVIPLRDLRAEIYSQATAEEFHAFWTLDNGWDAYLGRHGVTAVLARVKDPLIGALQTRGWRNMAVSNGYILLVGPRDAMTETKAGPS